MFEHEVSYSTHEVVRKDKYSKEDVTTPVEPVLTSRCEHLGDGVGEFTPCPQDSWLPLLPRNGPSASQILKVKRDIGFKNI